MKIIEITVADYLDALASGAPAPGGGSAAAFSGAQGAALLEMVCRLSIGKPACAAYETELSDILEKAGALRLALMQQIDADTQAYLCVTAAFKLPKDTDAEKAARGAAIQSAMLHAAEIPLQTMRLAHGALPFAQRLSVISNPNCVSDATVAGLNLSACIEGARENVLINLPYIKDEAARVSLSDSLKLLQ